MADGATASGEPPEGIHLRPGVELINVTDQHLEDVVVDEATMTASFSGDSAALVSEADEEDVIFSRIWIYKVKSAASVANGVEVEIGQFQLRDAIYGQWRHKYSLDELRGGAANQELSPGDEDRALQEQGGGFAEGCLDPDNLEDGIEDKLLDEIRKHIAENAAGAAIDMGKSAVLDVLLGGIKMNVDVGIDEDRGDGAVIFEGYLPDLGSLNPGDLSNRDRCRELGGEDEEECIERLRALLFLEIDATLKLGFKLPFSNEFDLDVKVPLCSPAELRIPLGQTGLDVVVAPEILARFRLRGTVYQSEEIDADVPVFGESSLILPFGFDYWATADQCDDVFGGSEKCINGEVYPAPNFHREFPSLFDEPPSEDVYPSYSGGGNSSEEEPEKDPLNLRADFQLGVGIPFAISPKPYPDAKLVGPELQFFAGPYLDWQPAERWDGRTANQCLNYGINMGPEVTLGLTAKEDRWGLEYDLVERETLTIGGQDLNKDIPIGGTSGDLLCLRGDEGENCSYFSCSEEQSLSCLCSDLSASSCDDNAAERTCAYPPDFCQTDSDCASYENKTKCVQQRCARPQDGMLNTIVLVVSDENADKPQGSTTWSPPGADIDLVSLTRNNGATEIAIGSVWAGDSVSSEDFQNRSCDAFAFEALEEDYSDTTCTDLQANQGGWQENWCASFVSFYGNLGVGFSEGAKEGDLITIEKEPESSSCRASGFEIRAYLTDSSASDVLDGTSTNYQTIFPTANGASSAKLRLIDCATGVPDNPQYPILCSRGSL